MNYKYVAYKNGKPIAYGNSLAKLSKIINVAASTLSVACRSGKVVCGKYEVKKNKGYKKEPNEKEEIPTPQIYKEWDEVVKPFKNVIWVKKGGRKLAVQKRD